MQPHLTQEYWTLKVAIHFGNDWVSKTTTNNYNLSFQTVGNDALITKMIINFCGKIKKPLVKKNKKKTT